jgi:AcrR family transcriptional regulator
MVYRRTARSDKVRKASRTRLLAAARKLFARQGYESTTMQQIVREADTSIGNAYFYFKNKEELLKTLLDEALRATWVRIDPVVASVEQGPARIAVAVYANIMTLLTTEKEIGAAAVNGAPAVVRHLIEITWERLVGLFRENFPDHTEKERVMCAVAVGGANRTAIEFSLAGIIKIPPRELAAYLLGWHLRALRLPPRQIDRVVEIAAAAFHDHVESSRSV